MLRSSHPRGAPGAVVPVHGRAGEDVEVGLRGERPVGKAHVGHDDGNAAGEQDCHHASLGLLLGAQVLEEPGRLRGAETGEDDSEEGVARQGRELRHVVETGDEWCAEEEHNVDAATHEDVEPEYGVVVAVGGLAQVGQCRLETAVLQVVADEREDADHGNHAEVRLVEPSGQNDAKHDAQQLLHRAVQTAPKQSFRCFLF